MKSTQSPLQRIVRIQNFYMKFGINKESVNAVYRKILATKFSKNATL
jgi:hypothetical protein